MKHLLISSPKANTQTHFSSSLENLELFYLLSLKSFSLLLLLLFLPPTIGGGAVLLDYFYDFDKAVKAPPNFFCFFVKGTLNRYVMAFWSKYEKGHSHTQRSSFIIASLKPSLWSLIYGRNQARNQTITQPILSLFYMDTCIKILLHRLRKYDLNQWVRSTNFYKMDQMSFSTFQRLEHNKFRQTRPWFFDLYQKW